MHKTLLLVIHLLLCSACSDGRERRVVTDDYVLIEFAARLEEEKISTLSKPVAEEPNK